MIFANSSQLTGNWSNMEFDMDEDDFAQRYNSWRSGMLIQEAFPMLNADQREFIMTGVTPEEWSKYFGEFDE
jgi:hypothetical protein